MSNNKIRLKRVLISPEALVGMMTQSLGWRTMEGVPAGAKVRGLTLDPHTNILCLFIEHESFPEVNAYTPAPTIDIEFLRIP